MSSLSQIQVDDSVYLFKQVNQAFRTRQGESTNKCFLLKKILKHSFWIVMNQSDDGMNHVLISNEAEIQIGKKLCAEFIHDKYQSFLRDYERLQRSPFYEDQ
jgi:hypothetical protein